MPEYSNMLPGEVDSKITEAHPGRSKKHNAVTMTYVVVGLILLATW